MLALITFLSWSVRFSKTFYLIEAPGRMFKVSLPSSVAAEPHTDPHRLPRQHSSVVIASGNSCRETQLLFRQYAILTGIEHSISNPTFLSRGSKGHDLGQEMFVQRMRRSKIAAPPPRLWDMRNPHSSTNYDFQMEMTTRVSSAEPGEPLGTKRRIIHFGVFAPSGTPDSAFAP